MKLKKIEIENFKCFQKSQTIDLSRLTILTGANSSGKSSLIYSIIGALQTGEFPLQYSTNGKYINMGDFKDISFNHKSESEIKIGFTIENKESYEITSIWIENPVNHLPELSSLDVLTDYLSLNISYKKDKYYLNCKYNGNIDPINKLLKPETVQRYFDNFITLIDDSKISEKMKKDKITENILDEIYSSLSINDLEFSNYDNLYKYLNDANNLRIKLIINQLVDLFKKFDKNMNFISSFRLNPERTYLERSKGDFKVEKYGEGYLDQLINWETKDTKQFKEFIEIMKDIHLFDEIKTKRIEGGRFEIMVKSNNSKVYSSLSDVGFGISQFLPIIIADLQLSDDSTLFVAQPEIHLHPSVQSSFGDFLNNSIKKTNKNYIIETHSEYLLNKLRLLIVKGELKTEDIFIYYLENTEGNSIIHQIEITKTGQILNAPKSFFDTYMIDIMEIAFNAAEQ